MGLDGGWGFAWCILEGAGQAAERPWPDGPQSWGERVREGEPFCMVKIGKWGRSFLEGKVGPGGKGWLDLVLLGTSADGHWGIRRGISGACGM